MLGVYIHIYIYIHIERERERERERSEGCREIVRELPATRQLMT